uniref:Uncharacterized protein n=1 Tax=uncultured marine crenarchaeote E48-1C TaxID=907718 RepID=G9BAT8_9ARCH|nr:hypothetical protein E48-1C_18 [uncultured marine crenarchaeote E48-1C]
MTEGVEIKLPTWICTECGAEYTDRCRKAMCSECGAPQEEHKKKE